MTVDVEMTIPVIDLADSHAATLVARACRETGFLVVTNHGVDRVLIDDACAVAGGRSVDGGARGGRVIDRQPR